MPDRFRRASARASALATLTVLALAPVAAFQPSAAFAGQPVAAPPTTPAAVPVGLVTPRELVPGGSTGFRLPFAPGIDVEVKQGWNTAYSHAGKSGYAYDFGMYEGTPVLASARGTVAHVQSGFRACGGAELKDAANFVTINHADGSATFYAHLATVEVEEGQVVEAGQEIATSGKTGWTGCMPHLHFARQEQGSAATASVPVYFEGYSSTEFTFGEILTAPEASCTLPAPAPAAKDAKAGGKGSTAPGAARGAGSGSVAVAVPLAIPADATGAFCGTYYAGTFDGPALFTRRDDVLSLDLNGTGPGGYWLDSAPDGYSARWIGMFQFASSGRYTIAVVATGGVRLSIDGVRVVDRWLDRPGKVEVVLTRNVGAGVHRIEVEHFSSGAQDVLKVGWGRFFADE